MTQTFGKICNEDFQTRWVTGLCTDLQRINVISFIKKCRYRPDELLGELSKPEFTMAFETDGIGRYLQRKLFHTIKALNSGQLFTYTGKITPLIR